jgi:hypothetical protein
LIHPFEGAGGAAFGYLGPNGVIAVRGRTNSPATLDKNG